MSPFSLFADWFQQAQHAPLVTEPTAMGVSTVSAGGSPSSRMVLLKSWDESGFVFYTNFGSRKGQELQANSQTALLFFWDFGTRDKPDQRQVRIEGTATRVSDEEADRYYQSRPLESRIGAWASEQSKPLASKAALLKRVAEYGVKFGVSPPRPPHWSGWRIAPHYFEFWKQGAFRLHERKAFTLVGGQWQAEWLNP